MKNVSSLLAGACTAGVLAFAAPAMATPNTTWDLYTNCTQTHGSGSACIGDGSSHVTNGNVYSFTSVTSPTLALTASAYHSNSSSNLGSANFLGEYIGSAYGLGVEDKNAPQHAVDNSGGYDFIVFQLPTGANFDSLKIYLSPFETNQDMNATIFYGSPTAALGIGTAPSVTAFSGLSVANLLLDGFKQETTTNLLNKSTIQEVDVPFSGSASSTINYVIVAASLTPGRYEDDFFKVNAITAIDTPPTGAPEPATLALLGSGLLGMGALRRRKAKNA